MKKILSFFLLALSVIVLASCIIVAEVPKYSITFRNNLANSNYNDVFDWYVKNSSGQNFEISSYPTSVSSGGGVSIKRDLDRDYYRVIFTFDDTTDNIYSDTYYQSSLFYLDSDTEYTITNSNSYVMITLPSIGRSAIGEDTTPENLRTEFQLVDSNGNVYPIYRCEDQ